MQEPATVNEPVKQTEKAATGGSEEPKTPEERSNLYKWMVSKGYIALRRFF